MKTAYLLCAAATAFVFSDCAASAMELLAPGCSPMSEADCAEAEVISLVPLSETQIRITLFPWLWADD